jgi:hypothetical protein
VRLPYRPCVCISSSNLLNWLTGFLEIWYEQCTVADYTNLVLFKFLQ